MRHAPADVVQTTSEQYVSKDESTWQLLAKHEIMHESFSQASPKANTIISENETRCRVTVSSYFAGAAKAEKRWAEAITDSCRTNEVRSTELFVNLHAARALMMHPYVSEHVFNRVRVVFLQLTF